MKSFEELVAPESDYFIYSPSKLAQDAFLYPLQCGIFSYLPGYHLTRDSFDSFLLMYIRKGEMCLTFEGHTCTVPANQFVLLDCHKLHSYSTSKGWECLWCHFDGITAEALYTNIVSRLGNVFSLPDAYPALSKLTAILKIFYDNAPVREPLLSKYLNDILTEFLLYTPTDLPAHNYAAMAEEVIAYVTEHFRENVTVETLAELVGLSQYHFIRTFKKETGFTPHEYIVNTRIATAKYLLKNSKLSVKDICFASGFSSESVFCGAFRRHQGMTPAQYRVREEIT